MKLACARLDLLTGPGASEKGSTSLHVVSEGEVILNIYWFYAYWVSMKTWKCHLGGKSNIMNPFLAIEAFAIVCFI